MSMTQDGFFWFRENSVIIPGVRGEHLLMHITDTHLHVWDDLSTEEERDEAERQEARWMSGKEGYAKDNGEPYGDEQKIPSTEAFEKLLALAEELRPEMLLLSGDNLDYMHPAGERYLAKKLSGYRGKFLAVPGNHEIERCEGVWELGLQVCDLGEFVIAGVDDRKKTVSDDDLAKLTALCDEGKQVIVLCHIPVSTECCKETLIKLDPYFFIDGSEDENARQYVSLLKDCENVKAVVCGHVHGYHRVEIAPGKPQIIGSQGMAGAVDLIKVKGE